MADEPVSADGTLISRLAKAAEYAETKRVQSTSQRVSLYATPTGLSVSASRHEQGKGTRVASMTIAWPDLAQPGVMKHAIDQVVSQVRAMG